MRIVWSPLALERVSEAAAYIARDNRQAAEKWVGETFDVVASLSSSPNRGRLVPEVERPDIREIFLGSFRIIYRIEANRITILTIRHGRRLLDVSELSASR